MKEIILYAFMVGFFSTLARWVLPYSKKFVEWFIDKLVRFFEKTVKGSKMGAVKKERVCKVARIFGIKSNEFLSELIDSTVETMNGQSSNAREALKQEISEEIVNKVEHTSTIIKNKISND